jgi:hypothetical protein
VEKTEIAKHCLLLTENNGQQYHAGSKARSDADQILTSFKFSRLINCSIDNNIPPGQKKNLYYYVCRVLNASKSYLVLHDVKNKVIFAQFPDYSPKVLHGTIKNLFFSNKMIFLVHDVDLLRDFGSWNDELEILNHALILIVHNEVMGKELRKLGVIKPKFINLDLFDYLIAKKPTVKAFQKAVVFAGNLGKSQFLQEWLLQKRTYDINLYGIGFDNKQSLPEHTHYCGSYSPDQLPQEITGGFGLVWDGNSVETCHGPFGTYTKYNNPHKFSLYIASGIPMIVWKEAAVANIVRKYDIGICVDNLQQVDDFMNEITPLEYQRLVKNAQELQKRVLNGFYLTRAIDKALEILAYQF